MSNEQCRQEEGGLMQQIIQKREEIKQRCAEIEGMSTLRVAQEFGPLFVAAFEMLSFGQEAILKQLIGQEKLLRERLPEQLYVGDVVIDPLEVERQGTAGREEKKTCERD